MKLNKDGFAEIAMEDVCDYRDEMFRLLEEHKKPIVLYGAGEVSQRVLSLLRNHFIIPDYQMVDAEFEKNTKYEYEPIRVHEICERYGAEGVTLLAAMKDYPYVEHIADTLEISDVYFMDNLYQTEEIDKNYFNKHIDEFFDLYNRLYDDFSRETLLAYIKTNLSHNPEYMFNVYDRGFQYFSLKWLELGDDEVFVNCGAYTGDTICNFLKCTNGRYQKIYAFEADKSTFKILDKNITGSNIIKINKGVYSHSGFLCFRSSSVEQWDMSPGMSRVAENGAGDYDIETCTIDEVMGGEKITLIHMDIEGSELPALQGAYHTLKRSRPRMAISAYHKKSDLISIPRFMKEIDSTYQFALRAYCPWSEELVLFAF